MRPDPGHGVDPVVGDTAEFDISLAFAGRGGGADDRDRNAAVPVRGGVCDARLPAGHPQLGDRRPGGRNQSPRPVAVAGPSPALARRHRARWSECIVGARRRRGRAARLPAGRCRRVAVGHHRRAQSTGRGDQRTRDHAHLPGRPPGKQHNQRTRAVVFGAAAGALAGDLRRPGSGRYDGAGVRGLHRLVLTRRSRYRPVELGPSKPDQ